MKTRVELNVRAPFSASMTGRFTSVENINRVRELRIRRIGQPPGVVGATPYRSG